MSRTRRSATRQGGAALLIMMLSVILAMATVLLVNLDRDELRARRSAETGAVLAAAKNALIDYAIVNAGVSPGRTISLPCPDIDDSGGFAAGASHTTSCGAAGASVIGRIPWRTLGIAARKDAGDACLWYVLSGSYKDAGPETAAMINTDTNGQLQLYNVELARVVEGTHAEDRPVAMLIAAMQPLAGQARRGDAGGAPCAPLGSAANYLETDSASGISNATLSGTPDFVDRLVTSSGDIDNQNDRFVTVSRREIERRLDRQQGFRRGMRELGLALASCIAHYAADNPAGLDDKRMPWPTAVAKTDYRLDSAYDDSDNGLLSGRLPDIVDDSNSSTANPIARVISDCDAIAVPRWTPAMRSAWQNWKDHFFYAVAASHTPLAPTPSTCGHCLTVNGSGHYAALLIYSNARLTALGQSRDAPPTDSDNKLNPANYLEARNALNVPGDGTFSDYQSGPESTTFNDLLFCIDEHLLVTEC